MCVGISAMLAGFGFSSLKMQFPPGTSTIIEIVYLSITACAIGFELCAILNSACCSVFGKFHTFDDWFWNEIGTFQIESHISIINLK